MAVLSKACLCIFSVFMSITPLVFYWFLGNNDLMWGREGEDWVREELGYRESEDWIMEEEAGLRFNQWTGSLLLTLAVISEAVIWHNKPCVCVSSLAHHGMMSSHLLALVCLGTGTTIPRNNQ